MCVIFTRLRHPSCSPSLFSLRVQRFSHQLTDKMVRKHIILVYYLATAVHGTPCAWDKH